MVRFHKAVKYLGALSVVLHLTTDVVGRMLVVGIAVLEECRIGNAASREILRMWQDASRTPGGVLMQIIGDYHQCYHHQHKSSSKLLFRRHSVETNTWKIETCY